MNTHELIGLMLGAMAIGASMWSAFLAWRLRRALKIICVLKGAIGNFFQANAEGERRYHVSEFNDAKGQWQVYALTRDETGYELYYRIKTFDTDNAQYNEQQAKMLYNLLIQTLKPNNV
jgi:hypothetical protein